MSSHQALLNELGLERSVDAHISKLLDDDEARLGKPLPRVLRDMYETPGLLGLLDNWFSNRFERPGALRTYPHQPSPLVSRPLWLASENQGVGHWVVPMDGSDDPPVYVTGDLRSGRSVARYADSLAEFFGAVAWDVTGVAGPDDDPIIQAQADPLDSVSIAFLEQRFVQRSTTHGWPCRDNRRFQRDDQRITLWSCDDQCDWWLVAQSPASLHRLVRDVIHLSDLKESLWSNDATGMAGNPQPSALGTQLTARSAVVHSGTPPPPPSEVPLPNARFARWGGNKNTRSRTDVISRDNAPPTAPPRTPRNQQ